ncbi:MAG: efflux RND transporter permease subunit, partial [candidate division Zixibacteria bacterium]|nr:efflux RND transporter permease subunit [candidate division Zixibacteria bacterium]
FRPILMTTVAMVLGMMPLALATNPGSELKNGMGWAMTGGLASGMFITLKLVPVVYATLDQVKVHLSQKMAARRAKKTQAAPELIPGEVSMISDQSSL